MFEEDSCNKSISTFRDLLQLQHLADAQSRNREMHRRFDEGPTPIKDL
jgi:hypothetical protein